MTFTKKNKIIVKWIYQQVMHPTASYAQYTLEPHYNIDFRVCSETNVITK